MTSQLSRRHTPDRSAYKHVIDEICSLNWRALSPDDLISVAWAYYYFSTQFRENLEIALKLYPDDKHLRELDRGERETDNLSPWPGIAAPGEKMNHDEFMRRALTLTPVTEARRQFLQTLGKAYLAEVHALDKMTRAISLSSYEDGGLEAVFRSILNAQNWDGELLGAFRHFLMRHIQLDGDAEAGHGALCRHLASDDRILPLWTAFRRILVAAAPVLRETPAQ